MIKKNTKHISKKLPTAFKMLSATTNLLTFAYLFSVNREVRFIPEFASYAINCFNGNFQKRGRIQLTKSQIVKI